MRKENFKAYLAWVNVCILWGTTYLAIRIGVEEWPPMLFAGLRWILAGIILIIFLKAKGYQMPGMKDFLNISVMGILLLGFGNGLIVVSEITVPSGLAALLITTVPFWIVGVEAAMPHGIRLNLNVLLGLIIGLLGVGVIFGTDLDAFTDPAYMKGIIVLLIGVFLWALGTLYSKYKRLSVAPLTSAAFQMLTAGVLQTLYGLITGEQHHMAVGLHGWMAFLYLVSFGSLIGYTSYIYAVTHLPVSFVSTYSYINPVIALILGWLVLGEKLDLSTIVAAAVIFAGVLLVKKGTGERQKLPQAD
ncbi:MAG: EamA family transporter [Bacteroidota bacterium]|jgi:drug/metabolite transporter (DMT)-like permease|nr:EamA family transporter [Ignavibacteria bacterium]MCU7500381.1 EamA family transporter [Ignavibacteria bacterium]MCU7512771.1 EamA family transporter [Ignavibacteria bacterium]MCU7520347.1 EamA family transporter [Ignavibacteria bacterium]MCU7523950.1 EamA family transporter [Ignavibacteria bacterium]